MKRKITLLLAAAVALIIGCATLSACNTAEDTDVYGAKKSSLFGAFAAAAVNAAVGDSETALSWEEYAADTEKENGESVLSSRLELTFADGTSITAFIFADTDAFNAFSPDEYIAENSPDYVWSADGNERAYIIGPSLEIIDKTISSKLPSADAEAAADFVNYAAYTFTKPRYAGFSSARGSMICGGGKSEMRASVVCGNIYEVYAKTVSEDKDAAENYITSVEAETETAAGELYADKTPVTEIARKDRNVYGVDEKTYAAEFYFHAMY